uniref:Uncharacterized protein n=1 Tax=Arundo donax TaxID=35708 RepID=A0A0A9TNG9_ARUDO
MAVRGVTASGQRRRMDSRRSHMCANRRARPST